MSKANPSKFERMLKGYIASCGHPVKIGGASAKNRIRKVKSIPNRPCSACRLKANPPATLPLIRCQRPEAEDESGAA